MGADAAEPAADPRVPSAMRRPTPDPLGPDQESVWAYPRPPALDRSTEHVVVTFAGVTLADSLRAVGGDFYGSWVTSRVVGPFKGGPGTEGW